MSDELNPYPGHLRVHEVKPKGHAPLVTPEHAWNYRFTEFFGDAKRYLTGPLADCPLHAMRIDLQSGELMGADAGKGCAPTVRVRVLNGRIELAAEALS